jgi:hypothetical protein
MAKKPYTTYLAGYIEANARTANNWREEFEKEFPNLKDLLIYNPIKQEAVKTGKPAGEHVDYVIGLKKAGLWIRFLEEMDKIWLGDIKPSTDLARLFKLLKDRASIDGNRKEELEVWGDYESVARSDFIIAYMNSKVQTVGTIGEIFEAMLLNIPVYLIIDTPKTETNSTLLYWVMYSGGEIFYNLKDCIKFIKEKYKI